MVVYNATIRCYWSDGFIEYIFGVGHINNREALIAVSLSGIRLYHRSLERVDAMQETLFRAAQSTISFLR